MFFLYADFFPCQIDQLAEKGKNYPWPVPDCCPKCNGRIWKNGFTTAYFYPISQPVFIRKLICPDCKSVFRFRPNGYLPYYNVPLTAIFLALFSVDSRKEKTPEISTETRKSWLKRLKKQIKLTLMKLTSRDYRNGFLELLEKGFRPVSYPANLRIPPGFTYSTEIHLFSG